LGFGEGVGCVGYSTRSETRSKNGGAGSTATYEIPEDRPHPHVHGCNLGVRGDAYLDAGGWPAIHLAEDHGLWDALRARGWRCLSDRWLRVITSGRPAGRARGGFADTLVALGAAS
jgi:hypothetical protein